MCSFFAMRGQTIMAAVSEFPADFLWGAATSAYQIEGATREGGRGESIWDRFARSPGAVERGETGDVACDHYHRWREDVDLIHSLGLRAYRFSIAWPRVVPGGRGAPNQAGLDFYRRLVDQLLERGVAPIPTLYHWDLPQPLEEAGGWTRRDTAERFADYSAVVLAALGDRVPRWITHNEPWCAAFLGYFRGVHAPGVKDLGAALAAAHHILLSHGRAVGVCRSLAPSAKIGIALSLFPTYPLHEEEEADRDAAVLSDAYTNRWFLDPVVRGAYPADGLAHLERLAGPIRANRDGDLVTISNPIDFLGVNYYHRRVIEAGGADLGWTVHDRSPGVPTTDLGWEIVPHCLTELLLTRARLPDPHPHHRERRRLRRRGRPRRPDPRPPPHRLPPRPHHRCPRRHRAGRPPRGLPRLVSPRQLRMGLRLLQALRHRPRRLPHPAPHPQIQRPLPLPPHPRRRPRPRTLIGGITRCARAQSETGP
jgi:beta-glucosidase